MTVVDQERANYYASVFTKDDENLPNFQERNITQPLEELEITNETVVKSLSNMKAEKSQGPDMIHPRIFNEISSQVIEPLKNYSGSHWTKVSYQKIRKKQMSQHCSNRKKDNYQKITDQSV